MDLTNIMLSEISQAEKDKQCMISLICGLLKKKKKSYRQRDQTCGYWKWRMGEEEIGER